MRIIHDKNNWWQQDEPYRLNACCGPGEGALVDVIETQNRYGIVLVASHAVNHFRADGSIKPADLCTGGLASWIGQQFRQAVVCRRRLGVPAFNHPCRPVLLNKLRESPLVFDIHGARDNDEGWDLAIGVGAGTMTRQQEKMLDLAYQAAADAGITAVSQHPLYNAQSPASLASWLKVKSYSRVLQFEFTYRLRCPTAENIEKQSCLWENLTRLCGLPCFSE